MFPAALVVAPNSVEKGGGALYSLCCNGGFMELDRLGEEEGEEENETESLGICGEVDTLVVSDLFNPNLDACCNSWLGFRGFLSIDLINYQRS